MLAWMRTGRADLPLHTGRAPAWLFERMRLLAREIARAVVEEEGPHGLLRRAADPFWFQAFGCVLGFDWHSSGVTTTVCGAVKEGIKDIDRDLGLFAAGGKGAASRKTPAPWPSSRACWSPTSPSPPWTPRCAARSCACAARCAHPLRTKISPTAIISLPAISTPT